MNTQRTFTKDDIIVTDIEYRASANGDGIIYLNLEIGTIEVDVESNSTVAEGFDILDYANYSYSYTNEAGTYSYHYLDDTSIEAVNEYLIENDIEDKYRDEVYEAVNQTF